MINHKGSPFGNSGITVNPIGLGGMPMSIQGRPNEAQSIPVICIALDNGIDFIDTTDVYVFGSHQHRTQRTPHRSSD
ncbi:aldo/keto reductase [Nitrospira defluvii]|nr:aldo/keto reductase [Nitrospira defluvii]